MLCIYLLDILTQNDHQEMKKIVLVVLVTLMVGFGSAYPTFDEYCLQFEKNYNQTQKIFRASVYEAKLLSFASITSFVPGVNKFTDWTQTEINGLSTLQSLPQEKQVSTTKLSRKLGAPTSIDWRNNGIITSIKDQGSCGACWAFTSAGLIESYLVKNGSQSAGIDLSEQYLLQCTSQSSCNGGFIQYGIDAILKSCPQESQYAYIGPYLYTGNVCSATGVDTKIVRSSVYNIADSELINLLAEGPVAVAVASTGWSSYSSGTITCSPSSQLDHAVIAIGYTADAYIIKNSWGTSWGLNGYGLVSRAAGSNCKILYQAHTVKNWGNFFSSFGLVFLALFLMVML